MMWFGRRGGFINYFFHFVYLEINLVPLHVYAFKSSFYFIHIFTYFLPAYVHAIAVADEQKILVKYS